MFVFAGTEVSGFVVLDKQSQVLKSAVIIISLFTQFLLLKFNLSLFIFIDCKITNFTS